MYLLSYRYMIWNQSTSVFTYVFFLIDIYGQFTGYSLLVAELASYFNLWVLCAMFVDVSFFFDNQYLGRWWYWTAYWSVTWWRGQLQRQASGEKNPMVSGCMDCTDVFFPPRQLSCKEVGLSQAIPNVFVKLEWRMEGTGVFLKQFFWLGLLVLGRGSLKVTSFVK